MPLIFSIPRRRPAQERNQTPEQFARTLASWVGTGELLFLLASTVRPLPRKTTLEFSEEFLELQTCLQFLLGQGPMRFVVAGDGAALKVDFVGSSCDLIMCKYK